MRSLVAMNLLLSLYHEGLTTNLRKLSSEECIRENERRGMLFQGRGSFGDDGRICRLFMRQFSSCLGRFGPQGFIGKKLRDKAHVKRDRKSTRLNSSHPSISYAVFCLKK